MQNKIPEINNPNGLSVTPRQAAQLIQALSGSLENLRLIHEIYYDPTSCMMLIMIHRLDVKSKLTLGVENIDFNIELIIQIQAFNLIKPGTFLASLEGIILAIYQDHEVIGQALFNYFYGVYLKGVKLK